MRFHIGRPWATMRFDIGTMSHNAIEGDRVIYQRWLTREVRGLYGISFGRMFIGVVPMGPLRETRERIK